MLRNLTKKKLLFICIGLILVNVILTVLLTQLDSSTYHNLDGTEVAPGSEELLRTVLFGQLISFPIISFLIGMIVAIFIDRELPYSRRIFTSFLLVLAIVYAIFALMGGVKVITFL